MGTKISFIFGTRPEAIKLAPLILALRDDPFFECSVCVTGQHRQMLDQVLDVFDITPDVDLGLMEPNQSLAGLTARAIDALDGYLAKEVPALTIVQGDTTTTLSASIAAFYRRIPVGHVEAGLRTWNLFSPWPEEANRVLTTRLARLHFAPTESNRKNLLKEGIDDSTIFVTGNTVIDALHLALERVKKTPPEVSGLPDNSLRSLDGRSLILVTGHRRENFGDGFRNICLALVDLAHRFPDCNFVFPVHLNPNVREPVSQILGRRPGRDSPVSPKLPNIYLIEPLPYISFIALMNSASLILTDSGGVQEEAPSLGKPVLVLRKNTERPEALTSGLVKIIGHEREQIVESVSESLLAQRSRAPANLAINPYGDGRAAQRIRMICRKFLA